MSQTKKASLIETCLSTAFGYLISLTVWAILSWAMGIGTSFGENVFITTIFTFVSLIRTYLFRRAFNWLHKKGILV